MRGNKLTDERGIDRPMDVIKKIRETRFRPLPLPPLATAVEPCRYRLPRRRSPSPRVDADIDEKEAK